MIGALKLSVRFAFVQLTLSAFLDKVDEMRILVVLGAWMSRHEGISLPFFIMNASRD
jgi:hypothetical protein